MIQQGYDKAKALLLTHPPLIQWQTSCSKTLQEELNKLESYFEDEAFDEAADLLENNATLLAEFKSPRAGKLLQAIFENVSDYSALKAMPAKEKGLDDLDDPTLFSAPDRLLALLKKETDAVIELNPAHAQVYCLRGACNGSQNDINAFLQLYPGNLSALALKKKVM